MWVCVVWLADGEKQTGSIGVAFELGAVADERAIEAGVEKWGSTRSDAVEARIMLVETGQNPRSGFWKRLWFVVWHGGDAGDVRWATSAAAAARIATGFFAKNRDPRGTRRSPPPARSSPARTAGPTRSRCTPSRSSGCDATPHGRFYGQLQ